MKLLIVSWYFPPSNTMGALRVGKFAKFMHERGHDVRVLTAQDLPFHQNLPLEFPEVRIRRVPWLDVNGLPRLAQRFRIALRGVLGPGEALQAANQQASNVSSATPSSGQTNLLRRMRTLYASATNWPDAQIGWFPYAVQGGKKLLADWRPDLIFASAPPFTTLMVGKHLAVRFGVPWIAEYRDRWFEDPYDDRTEARRRREKRAENRTVASAVGFVTVSEPWARDYEVRFQRPVAVAYNGFDPDDFAAQDTPAPKSTQLRIVYTGILYPERRDPSPLFAALGHLPQEIRETVRVEFYGADHGTLSAMARQHGAEANVHTYDRVSYREALTLQRNADLLLLLQWNDSREQGNVPGKLFEYLAARRPVLNLGYAEGVPARLLREREGGVTLSDPLEIARYLQHLAQQKTETGDIPLLPSAVSDGLSRAEQYRKIDSFLENFLHR